MTDPLISSSHNASGEKIPEPATHPNEKRAEPEAPDATAAATEPLEAAPAPTAALDSTLQQPRPAGTDAQGTAQRPSSGNDLHLRDVTGTAKSYLHSRVAAVGSFARAHKIGTAALCVLLVAAVGLLAVAFAQSGNVPTTQEVEKDALTRLEVPAWEPGSFDADDILVARSATVRSVQRTATALASEGAQFGASGYAAADVLVTYAGSSVQAEKTATLGYARTNNVWGGVGDPANEQIAWTALTGVDVEKVVANVGVLLAQAEAELEQGAGTEGAREMTLAQIYEGAEVSVTSESFDAEAQTDVVTIECVKASPYESYACSMTATFGFSPASGQWSVSSLDVNKDAKTRTFDPLVGTWTATFQSQKTDGTKCLAAGTHGLALTISKTRTDANGAQLTGTISGLAHYHAHPSQDTDSQDGDKTFDDVSFTATLVGGKDDATGSELAFVATLPEEVGGTVTVTLGFGTSEDPSRVVAVVKTTYPHTGSFLFIPFEETIVYEDVFVLERAE